MCIRDSLNADQKDALLKLLDEFAYVFVEKPGLCNEGVHEIHVTLGFISQRTHSNKVRMPFGLMCASNSFIRALQQLLFHLRDFCDSYVNDIAAFTPGRTKDRQVSWPLHLEQVRAFLLTMRKAGLTLKLEKCKFAQSSVTFVGHTIRSGLHGPDPHKVACVQDMKPPNSKK